MLPEATTPISPNPIVFAGDKMVWALKKVVKIEESRRKSLAEARGYVVADYQDQLEQKWVNQLKKQYPIKVSDSVYKSLIKK